MDLQYWDFSQFTNYKPQRSQTKLYHLVINQNRYTKLIPKLQSHFIDMLSRAEKGETIKIRAGIKYAIAKFINRYHKLYKWNKRNAKEITCCHCYPRYCGGFHKYYIDYFENEQHCKCGDITDDKKLKKHKILWKELDYDDTHFTYGLELQKSRTFLIKWEPK